MLSLKAFIKGLLTQNENDRTKELLLEASDSATASTRTTVSSSQTADRTINLPDADDTLMGRATTDTVSNKTLDNSNSATFQDNSLTIQDDADNTKQAQFDASSISTATTRTLSLPDADDTLVAEAAGQTLTNKVIEGNSSGTNVVTTTADNVEYDPASSGLTATNSQAAIDEIEGRIETVEDNKLDGPGTHADNSVPRFDGVNTNDIQASNIVIDDSDNITGVNGITTTGDVTVGGNLQVDGTTTSVNSATLEVEDANIVVNNNGNQASANSQGAGLTVEMSDATDAKIAYDSTLTSRFKIGDDGAEVEVADVSSAQTFTNKTIDADNNTISNLAHGAEVDNPTSGVHGVTGDVVGTSDAQVLTAKDIDGGTASDTSRLTVPQADKATLDGLTRKEGTLLYANDLDTFFGDNGTDLFEIGSGVGEKNYFDDGNFENNIDLATTYDDGGSYTDGTGGTPSFISVAQNATNPLNDDSDLAITKAIGDATGEGVTLLSRTIDRADLGRPLFFSLEVDATDADYTSGNLQLKCYDVTNAEIINIFGIANLDDDNGILQAKTRIQAVIYPENTTEQVRISLHQETDSATGSSWTINVDDAKLKTDSPQPGVIMTDWTEPETLVLNNGTLPSGGDTNQGLRWKRLGDLVIIQAWYNSSTGTGGVNPGVGNVTFELPVALQDKTLNVGANTTHMGVGGVFSINDFTNPSLIGNTAFISGRLWATQLTTNGSGNPAGGANLSQGNFSVTGPQLRFTGTWFAQIEEWKSGNLVSNFEAALSAGKASIARSSSSSGQTIAVGGTEEVEFDTVEFLEGGMSTEGGNQRVVVAKSGYYHIESNVGGSSGNSSTRRIQIQLKVNGTQVALGQRTGNINGGTGAYIAKYVFLNKGDVVSVDLTNNTNDPFVVANSGNNNYLNVIEQPDLTHFGTFGQAEVIDIESANFRFDSPGFANLEWAQLTGNSAILTPGIWVVNPVLEITDGGANGAYAIITLAVSEENGANNTLSPSNISNAPGVTVLSGDVSTLWSPRNAANNDFTRGWTFTPRPVILQVTEPTEVFINARIEFNNDADQGVRTKATIFRYQ